MLKIVFFNFFKGRFIYILYIFVRGSIFDLKYNEFWSYFNLLVV